MSWANVMLMFFVNFTSLKPKFIWVDLESLLIYLAWLWRTSQKLVITAPGFQLALRIKATTCINLDVMFEVYRFQTLLQMKDYM